MANERILKTRVEWIDCAKGFAILLVIIGHTCSGIIRGAIFSFHMPLFFILSCMTFRCSNDYHEFRAKTIRAFKHLIIPVIYMYGLTIVINIIQNIENFNSLKAVKEYCIQKLLAVIFASGVAVNVSGYVVGSIGIPWFFVVLFLGRSLFDYLQLKMSNAVLILSCVVLSIAGVLLGSIQWLPLSFDIAFAVMPFFLIGQHLKNVQVEKNPSQKAIIYFAVWAVSLLCFYIFTKSYMELACRRYTLYPICYITAFAGTMFVTELSVILTRVKIIKPMIYLGRYSLYMVCVHMMDYCWTFAWKLSSNEYINSICRMIADVVVFAIFIYAKRQLSIIWGKKKGNSSIKDKI